jgi:hypothetical protein
LNSVLLNCTPEDGEVVATFRRRFDDHDGVPHGSVSLAAIRERASGA